jgi:hypothetical protein
MEDLIEDAHSRREGRDIQITTPGIAARLPGKVNGNGFGGDVTKAMADEGKEEAKTDGNAVPQAQPQEEKPQAAQPVVDDAKPAKDTDLFNGKPALKDDEKELLDTIATELKTATTAAAVNAISAAFAEDISHATAAVAAQASDMITNALAHAKKAKGK